MSSKVYTAQEMREESNKVTRYDCYVASAMLRQAADAMEREEKRKKRKKTFEYVIEYKFKPKGFWHADDTIYDNYDEAFGVMAYEKAACDSIDGAARYWRIVRREVGRWKEVRDDY